MRRSSNYLLLFLFVMTAMIIFPGVECNKSNEEEEDIGLCGGLVLGGFGFHSDYFQDNLSAHRVYLTADKASYTFWPELITDVCAHKHVNVKFGIYEYYPSNEDFEFHGRVDWLLYTAEVSGWEGSTGEGEVYWDANLEVGLLSAFGDEPGMYSPVITISFPDQGSEELNEEYFRSKILRLKWLWEHFAWKENP